MAAILWTTTETHVVVIVIQLFEVAQEGHLIWSCPLSMTVVSILLLIVMGPSTLVGMAVLFLFVPLVKGVASAMLAIRHKRAKLSDERVETVNAMLQGVSAKMFCSCVFLVLRISSTRDSSRFG